MSTKLVSMALTPADRADMKAECAPSDGKDTGPRYPWGLSLNLDDDTLEKLGIDGLMEVGETYTLTAKCRVTGANSNEYEVDGQPKTRRSVSLQITDMAFGGSSGDSEQSAGRLYDGNAAEAEG